MQDLRDGPVQVDVSRVESVSTLCIQVLLSAAATWRAADHDFELVGGSPAFQMALDHLGLDIGAFHAGEMAA